MVLTLAPHAERVVLVSPPEITIESPTECSFRHRYAKELGKKRMPGIDNYHGPDELLEEKLKVNQQQMKTPGRRGEIIKQEEIAKEIVRRLSVQQKSSVIKK